MCDEIRNKKIHEILMTKMFFRVLYFCIVSAYLNFVHCAKYDIDAEAQKLFGEDLESALKRFRRSYEYMNILRERVTIIETEYADSIIFLKAYYDPMMETQIKKMLGIKEDATNGEEAANGEDPPDAKRQRHLRQEEEEEKELTDVQLLDAYVTYTRELNVQEINSFVDLGFEFAGKTIHGTITNMGGGEYEKSKSSGKQDQVNLAANKYNQQIVSTLAAGRNTKSQKAFTKDLSDLEI